MIGPKNPSEPASDRPLSGYEVVVCVTGGIAAYKTAGLVSQLVQQRVGVTVAMTRSARRFVGPTTFRALTRRPVLTSLWRTHDHPAFGHLDPGEKADLIIVAPATANILGKLAGGIADDLVSTLLLGAACPVMVAPAMNTRMWQHPAVQRNVDFLRQTGVEIEGPDDGWLACGDVGPGRMVAPETLLQRATALLGRTPPKKTTPTK